MAKSEKFLPGSDAYSEDIFDFVYLVDDETIQTIVNHGRIMFIIRGPPGTGKNSLRSMILQKYEGVLCSADDYFTKTFNSAKRTQESLKNSHEHCQKRVKQACTKGAHPIIVSNTHIKKNEMQMYLNFAQEYGYTVIMAVTTDKFKISPEILAKSNTKGLTKEYFQRRLQHWQDVYPILTGWFLCADDCSFILEKLQSAVEALFGDGKFCRVFNAVDRDQLFKEYQAKEVLFAVAAYSKDSLFELKNYIQSAEVKESYGKFFKLFIEAFVITKTDFFAVVSITDDMKHLMWEPPVPDLKDSSKDDDISDITSKFRSLLPTTYTFKSVPLNSDFSDKIKTAKLEENESLKLNGNKLTFIHLAQKGNKAYPAWGYVSKFKQTFEGCTNSFGDIELNSATELEGGYSMLRLPNEKWLVKPFQRISVDTIFTGLYI